MTKKKKKTYARKFFLRSLTFFTKCFIFLNLFEGSVYHAKTSDGFRGFSNSKVSGSEFGVYQCVRCPLKDYITRKLYYFFRPRSCFYRYQIRRNTSEIMQHYCILSIVNCSIAVHRSIIIHQVSIENMVLIYDESHKFENG